MRFGPDYAKSLRAIANDYFGPHEQTLLDTADHIDLCHKLMIDASDYMVSAAEEIERLHSALVEIAKGNNDPYECGWYRDMAWRALREGK